MESPRVPRMHMLLLLREPCYVPVQLLVLKYSVMVCAYVGAARSGMRNQATRMLELCDMLSTHVMT